MFLVWLSSQNLITGRALHLNLFELQPKST